MSTKRGPANRRRAPSVGATDNSSIVIKAEAPEEDDQRNVEAFSAKRFQEIEERRQKEWDDYQRSQRSRSNLEATTNNPKVYLDIAINEGHAGRMVIELMEDVAPQTVQNFRKLVTGVNQYHKETGVKLDYIDSPVTKIVPGLAVYLGELGSVSIGAEGQLFQDENFALRHSGRGLLSMVNQGPNTNGSAFCITLDKAAPLDYKQVVFGKVVDQQSMAVLEKIEQMSLTPTGQPKLPIAISFCGALSGERPKGHHVSLEEWLKDGVPEERPMEP